MTYIDAIGYFGLVINLYSMSSTGEYRLRYISVIANIIYIIYGFLLGAFPIVFGCSLAVFLHLYNLNKLKTEIQ